MFFGLPCYKITKISDGIVSDKEIGNLTKIRKFDILFCF